MFLKTAAKNLLLTFEIKKVAILSAMEYRISFIFQVVGMMINNTGFVLIWLIYFARFPSLNGWSFHEMALLLAINSISYGLVWIFAYGAVGLSKSVTKGEIDRFLSMPQNTLWQISVSKTEMSAIGDLFFGLIMLFISNYTSWQNILIFLLVIIFSSIVLYSFIISTQSLAFFLGDFEGTSREFINTILGLTMYPQGIYGGALKLLIMTVIPAYFVAALPIQIIRFHDYTLIIYLALASFVFFAIANLIFKAGLKRYESGNQITLNI